MCAGRQFYGASGAPPSNTGMTWSTVVAPGFFQIQQTSLSEDLGS